jgi:Ca2+-binding RTX toxin-like protein
LHARSARPALLRLAVLAAAGLAAGLANAAAASADSCTYDSAAKRLTAEIAPGSTATLRVVGGELWFGFSPAACAGATTTNTDSIAVAGAAGSNERLVLDLGGGAFAPGAAPESNLPEIEIAAALGDAGDRLVVVGTDGPDRVVAGQSGVLLNTDGDADLTLTPAAMELEASGLGGNDTLAGRGFLAEFLGPLWLSGGDGNDTVTGSVAADSLSGGPGDDTVDGQAGDDTVDGGDGTDTLKGGSGNDAVTGGAGGDTLNTADGDDTLYVEDGVADLLLNGGPGHDTAYLDFGLDPTPSAVEVRIATPPPPPPAGSCLYTAATRSVTAQLSAGGAPQRIVVAAGGAIAFGGEAVAPCGAATTTNTDSITLVGTSGFDHAVVDESGGWFVPGATIEADTTSEIEIAVNLGDTTDELTVVGAERNDNVSVGQSGVALNADGDNDVTWSTRLAKVTVHGMGGRNVIAALGGSGAGSAFAGEVILHAGPNGDTLRGSVRGDTLFGGAGNDILDGRGGEDRIDGGAGNDDIRGADGADVLTGGPGVDTFTAGDGADSIHAADGEADGLINGGPLSDTVYYDAGLDVSFSAVEILIAS